MSNDPRIIDLLRRWRQAQKEARTLPPEELCADCPALLDELRRQIELLGRLERRLKRWKKLRKRGQPTSAEELCRTRPELVPPLARLIRNWERRLTPNRTAPQPRFAFPFLDKMPPRVRRCLMAMAAVVAILGPIWAIRSIPTAQSGATMPDLAIPGFIGEARCFRGHQGAVLAIALSPDERRFLSGSNDRTLALWDIATGRKVADIGTHSAAVTCIALSPSGRTALAGTADGTLSLWDLDNGAPLQRFEVVAESGFAEVIFSSDGSRALSRGMDDSVSLWDIGSLKRLARCEARNRVHHAILFAPGDRPCVLCGETRPLPPGNGASPAVDDPLVLWDVQANKEFSRLQPATPPHFAVAAPGGSRLLTWWPGRLAEWDCESGKQFAAFAVAADLFGEIRVSPDGRLALGGTEASGEFDVWDLARSKKLRRFDGHEAPVTCAVFARDGRFAITGSSDRTMRLWLLPDLRLPPEGAATTEAPLNPLGEAVQAPPRRVQ